MALRKLAHLNALRAFEAVARHGSFVAASRELSVTSGALSQQVRLLEDYYGVRSAKGARSAKAPSRMNTDGIRMGSSSASSRRRRRPRGARRCRRRHGVARAQDDAVAALQREVGQAHGHAPRAQDAKFQHGSVLQVSAAEEPAVAAEIRAPGRP